MKEISDTYRQCKHKKEKEQLLANIKNVMVILEKNIGQSTDQLTKLRQDYSKVQQSYNESIIKEKEHFKRIKDFEEECDKNDEYRKRMSGKK